MTENSDTLRRLLYCFVDRGVAGASAEVAADRVRDLVARGPRGRVEQRFRGHEHARRAITALRRALFGERDLKGVQRLSDGKPLDGRDVGLADKRREGEAGED